MLAAPPAGDGRSYGAFIDYALLHGATIVAARTDELSAAATSTAAPRRSSRWASRYTAAEPLRLFAVA